MVRRVSHPVILALSAAYVILSLATLAYQVRHREGFGKRWMRILRYTVWTLFWWIYWPMQHGLIDTWLIVTRRGESRHDNIGRS